MGYYEEEPVVEVAHVSFRLPIPLRDRLQTVGRAWAKKSGRTVTLTDVVLRLLEVGVEGAEKELKAGRGATTEKA